MNTDLQKISQNYKQVIASLDEKLALETISTIEIFLKKNDVAQSNPSLHKKLNKILIYLKIISFSHLSDKESCDILRVNVLEFFEIGISLEMQLTSKLFYIEEALRDKLRKSLKVAIVANKQKIGTLTIGQWIQEFEKTFNVKTRNENSSIEFFSSNSFAQTLHSEEKNILKEIIHVYDLFLTATLPATGKNLENILNYINENREEFTNIEESHSDIISQESIASEKQTKKEYEPKISQLNITQILSSYPEVGEQIITSAQIKVEGSEKFVRPSLENWLNDYKLSMKGDHNTPVERNTYLFKNANAAQLGQTDRTKLAEILKSFDERSLLSIDTANKVLLFSDTAPKEAVQNPRREMQSSQNSQKFRITRPATPRPTEKNIPARENVNFSRRTEPLPATKPAPAEESNIANTRFSSPQKMVSEKNVSPQETPRVSPGPVSAASLAKEKISFSEELKRLREKQSSSNKADAPVNVVNLKDLT